MTVFEQAWTLVKMPIHETGIPGIRFVTQGEDEPRWEDMDNVFGYVPSKVNENPSVMDRQLYGQSEIKPTTPSEFLTMLGYKGGRGIRGDSHNENLTPREAEDYFYRDLMDRAQDGEDILFGMPYIRPDMDIEDLQHGGHEGRHRMAELFARGFGDKPLPVKVTRGGI